MKVSKLCCFLLIFQLTSCISYRYIDVQVLNPGSMRIPANETFHLIKNLNSQRDCYINYKDYTETKRFNYYDTLFSAFYKSFSNKMKKYSMFENSRFIADSLIHRGSKGVYLILDTVDVGLKTFRYIGYNEYDITITFKNRIKGKFYSFSNGNVVLRDSIHRESTKYRNSSFYVNQMSDLSRFLTLAGNTYGEELSAKLTPQWTIQERLMFYYKNRFLRKGYYAFVNDNIDEAINQWTHLYKVGTPSLASIAAHNIALMYEISDDLDNTELWLNNALKIKKRYQTEEYLAQIKKRQADRKKLEHTNYQ
jgi:hypothetical protein